MNETPLNKEKIKSKRKLKYNLELLKGFPELVGWLIQIVPYRQIEKYVYISDYKDSLDEKRIVVRLYTKNYYYPIHVIKPKNGKSKGYLGAYVQNRKPRAGEEWTRGNDLPDGECNNETWNDIKNGILKYEFVKVVKNSEYEEDK